MADSTYDVDAPVEGKDVELLDIPRTTEARIKFVSKECQHVIGALAAQSKRAKRVPDRSDPKIETLFARLDRLLLWLDIELEMTPKVRKQTRIDGGLEIMFKDGPIYFPQEYKDKARDLYEKWEGENWGNSAAVDDVVGDESESASEEEGERQPKRRKTSATAKAKNDPGSDNPVGVVTLRLPRSDDPVFGKDSHMFGVALKQGRRKGYVLDPRYVYQKRNAKVYGHNGLEIGAWFPYQIVALFRGAHGSSMAGIAGDKDKGAYSIVVAGFYEGLDTDNGEYLFYSGSNSHDNENPSRSVPSTAGTLALKASLASGQPVRVLRSASGKSKYAPFCGLRYDGLYTVVDIRERKNGKGGLYEQFKLERRDGQAPIAINRPSPTEMRDYEKIKR